MLTLKDFWYDEGTQREVQMVNKPTLKTVAMGDSGIFYDGNSYPKFPQKVKEKPGRGRDIVSSRTLFDSSVRS